MNKEEMSDEELTKEQQDKILDIVFKDKLEQYKKRLVEEINKYIDNYPILEFKKTFKREIIYLINNLK